MYNGNKWKGLILKVLFVFCFQLKREPRPYPKLVIKRDVKDIDDFKMEDFEIVGYNPYPKIQMDMAV